MKYLAILIILLATVLRFYDLANPPLFYDESVHAVILKTVLDYYKYDPAFHGPLHYYTVHPIVSVFGESEFTLRLVPATLGVLLVASVFLYKRYLHEKVFLAALFIAVSPIVVNYSRFYREDIYVLLFTSLGLYFFLRYLEFEKDWKEIKLDEASKYFLAFSIFMALFATVKETFYVFAFFMLIYSIFRIKSFRIFDLLLGSVVFFFIYLTFFSVFWRENVLTFENFPMVKAVSYWLGQHLEARIGGPPYYFILLIFLYDLPALVLAILAIKKFFKKADNFTGLFIYLFFANLVFFSYMQEKLPWLVLHIEFPMFILASKVAGKKSFVISSAFLLYGCIALNFLNPVNFAEPAIYLPTNYEVRDFASKIGEGKTVYFVARSDEIWPMAWYIKKYTGSYPYISECKYVISDILILNESCARVLNLDGDKIVARCYNNWPYFDPYKLPKFFVFRTPLSDETYCLNYYIIKK